MKDRHLVNNDTQTPAKGETISQLVRRHIRDKNHTTTDEELRNARIEFNDITENSMEDLSQLSKVDNSSVLPEQHTPSVPNPYEILK